MMRIEPIRATGKIHQKYHCKSLRQNYYKTLMSKNFEELNQRTEKRIVPVDTLFVKNEQTSENMGQILNFSVNGFHLKTDSQLEMEKEYLLSYNIPVDEKILQFRASCRWKRIDPSTGLYWAGFRVSHRGNEKIALIKAIIEKYSNTKL